MSNNIDKIMYINLDSRVDRKIEIENELIHMNLCFERFKATDIPYWGSIGCSYSHYNVIQYAEDNKFDNILILEDDFQFLVSKEELERKLQMFFDTKIDYDVCMFSYNLKEFQETEYDFLYKVTDAQTTSGYLVNNKYYNKLLNNFKDGIALFSENGKFSHGNFSIDIFWKTLQKTDNWYCFKDRIGRQRPGFSNISNCFVDLAC
jgi:glycosyl transferase family 25